MNNQAIAAQLEGHAAALLETAKKLRGEHPAPAGGEAKNVAPFGRYASGEAKPAPAYDKCRALWEAAGREQVFNIHAFIGQGIQQGAAQMYSGHETDWQAVEDAIVALGKSEWGKKWLSYDVNAELIDKEYLFNFVGYNVQRSYDARGDLVGYKRIYPKGPAS